LSDYTGRDVIVGVRPEDLEDAAFVPSANGCCLDVRVSLAEPMGAEVIAHFPVAAEPVLDVDSLVAARGDDEEDAVRLLQRAAGHDTGELVLTARLNTRSRAQTGRPLRIAVDVERLHFFDPETEEAIV
jgi:multiple sugar transport system ATP-binding protein